MGQCPLFDAEPWGGPRSSPSPNEHLQASGWLKHLDFSPINSSYEADPDPQTDAGDPAEGILGPLGGPVGTDPRSPAPAGALPCRLHGRASREPCRGQRPQRWAGADLTRCLD